MTSYTMINFVHCGQSFAKDVGIYELTTDEIQASVDRCRAVDDSEELADSDLYEDYDELIYNHMLDVEELLSGIALEHVYIADKDDYLFFVGADYHFAHVVGSIVAVQHGKGHLPSSL